MHNYKLYKVAMQIGCMTDTVEVHAMNPAHARRLAKRKLQEIIDNAKVSKVELVYGEKVVQGC